jgi:[protein-PII] uridylyltransferase
MQGPASAPSIALGQLAPALGEVCADYLKSYRAEIERTLGTEQSGVRTAMRFARVLDGLLSSLFCAASAAGVAHGRAPQGKIALVAVGGYGRNLVALHSDIDVLVLAEDPTDPCVAAVAEGFLYPLWDLGFSIGHAVRGVEETIELARTDIRTATTLLDLRHVAGDRGLTTSLMGASRTNFFDASLEAFLKDLEDGLNERHEKFGGSLYLLEPEVKMGRGGMRDIDVAAWAARARWNAAETADLVKAGALLGREVEELEEAREFLWRVRNGLHLRAGRRQDRLTFEDQEELAPRLGFLDTEVLGVERFMQAYYRHAQIVAQTAERMLIRAMPRHRPKKVHAHDQGDGTLLFDGFITLRDTAELETDPALALRLYGQVLRTGHPPYPFARDAVARIAVDPAWSARLRASDEARTLFLKLLTHHGSAAVRRGSVLGELHEVGLLLAMIPEFEPVTGRVQHDVYHVYTVDVHSVAAVDRLHDLVRGNLKSAHPLPCRLAAEAPRPVPLFVGLLLHDIGKAHGKDHSEKGAVMSTPITARLGLSPEDQRHVEWLVRQHLSLYHWATRRDTTDPETLEEIAREVGTAERLRDLYLLTFADLSTTNPGAMTAWKARMFEDLYMRLVPLLEGSARVVDRAKVLRAEARAAFKGDPLSGELVAFLESMPDRYVLATPPETIRAHGLLARGREETEVRVHAKALEDGESTEFTVAVDDRPGLLADITAVLAANRLSVGGAEIYSRTRIGAKDEAFDVFLVRHHNGARVDVQATRERIEKDLRALLGGQVTQAALLSRLPATPAWAQRRTPGVRTEVVVDNGASKHFTVVDVFTRDRVGLLHDIARVLHEEGVSIALSRIGTEGDRAADVFYVRDRSGSKIEDPARLDAIAGRLRALLGSGDVPAGGEGA